MNDDDLIRQRVELWKTTVETQQHFNTLQLQLRNFALTLFLAIVGVAGVAIKEHFRSGALAALGAGVVLLVAFYQMDWGYHQLLKGAVSQGTEIEESLNPTLPQAGLAKAITAASSAKRLFGIFPTRSTWRLNCFYGLLAIALAGVGIAAWTVVPAPADKPAERASQGAWNFSPVVGIGVLGNHNELGWNQPGPSDVDPDRQHPTAGHVPAPAPARTPDTRAATAMIGGDATATQPATQTAASAPTSALGTRE